MKSLFVTLSSLLLVNAAQAAIIPVPAAAPEALRSALTQPTGEIQLIIAPQHIRLPAAPQINAALKAGYFSTRKDG